MPNPPLSFDRATYGEAPLSLAHCDWCGRGLADAWYMANSQMICPVCAERARALLPQDTRKAFWKAVSWGALAAIGSSAVLFVLYRFLIGNGAGYGFVLGTIPVGLAIGKTMRWASKGAGGRKYQIAAALLAYGAICIGAAPLFFRSPEGMPLLLMPLLPLVPLVRLFTGHVQESVFMLFIASIGVRWAWGQLPPLALKITGPESSR